MLALRQFPNLNSVGKIEGESEQRSEKSAKNSNLYGEVNL